MPNPSKFRDRIAAKWDRDKNTSGMRTFRSGGTKTPTVRMNNFKDNSEFIIRPFPPHPERCAEGSLHIIYHVVEPTPNCNFREEIQILASQCYENQATAPKYMDELIAALAEDVQPIFNQLSPALQQFIDKLNEKSRLLIPCLIYCREENEEVVEKDDNGNERKYNKRTLIPDPQAEPRPYIWEITAEKFQDRWFQLLCDCPYLSDPDVGFNIRFNINGRQYKMEKESNPSPFPPGKLNWIKEDYPRLDSWLKNYRKSSTEMYNAVANSWAGPELAALTDISP